MFNLLNFFFQFFEKFHNFKIKKLFYKKKINYIIDVGAYEGNFIKNFNNNSLKKVIFIEPNFNQFYILKKKFKNKYKYKIYNYAISNYNGKSYFYINQNLKTSCLSNCIEQKFSHKIKSKISTYNKKVLVNVKQLDTFIKNKNYKNSLLKIDVEGNELRVLLGSKTIMKNFKYIFFEHKFITNKDNKSKIFNLLRKNNFILKNKVSTFPYHFTDYLFQKK